MSAAALRPRSDLALAAAWSLVAVAAAGLLPEQIAALRLVIAGPLVLVLPGYALARAAMRPGELRGAELGVLSVALSVVVTIFSALILDAFDVKLRLWPWIAVLALVTLAAATVAARRGHVQELRRPAVGPRVGELVVIAGAIVLIAAAAAIGFTPLAAPKDTDGTTAFGILPTHPTAIDVTNGDLRARTYDVAVTVSGRAFRRFGPFTLAPGGTWSARLAIAGKPAVLARLTVVGNARAARTVSLNCWCTNVRSGSTTKP